MQNATRDAKNALRIAQSHKKSTVLLRQRGAFVVK